MESTGQRQCMDLYIHLYDDTLKLREGGVREVRGGEERGVEGRSGGGRGRGEGEWREGVVEGGGEGMEGVVDGKSKVEERGHRGSEGGRQG